MTLDASFVLPYGRLERTEVYFSHDGPRFFALTSVELDTRLVAICIDEDEETNEVEFLYLAMSPRRFLSVRAGQVPLLEAFKTAGDGQIWRVVERYADDTPTISASSVRFEDLSECDLPTREARLQIPTPTAPPLDERELRSIADQTIRSVAAIELTPRGENQTEFPLRGLGAIGTATQDALDALAQEESGKVTDRGPLKASITEEVQMSALGVRAASFALLIGTDKRDRMTEYSERVGATLARLTDLIKAGSTEGELVGVLRGYGPRARNKFTALLRAVFDNESGIGLLTAPLEGESRSAQMTAVDVTRELGSIDQVEPTRNTLDVHRGVLLGSNTRLGTFDLFDSALGTRYPGRVTSPTAKTQINGLPVGDHSFVKATVIEEIEFAAEDQEKGRKYFLESIEVLEE